MLQAIIFDLDGTLSDRDAAVARFAVDQYWRLVAPAWSETAYVSQFVTRDQHGYVPKARLYREMCDELVLTQVTPETLTEDFYRRIRDFQTPMPHLHEMLAVLRARGLSLGIITNGSVAMQHDTIDALGIRDAFDAIVISEAMGVKKPDPAIFHHALQALNVTPGEAVFVGDHPVTDIRAAIAVGIPAIWKRVPYWPAANLGEMVIDDLGEIAGVVEALLAMTPELRS